MSIDFYSKIEYNLIVKQISGGIRMVFCTNCGKEALEEMRFCIECGTALTGKAHNEKNRKYDKCVNCGAEIELFSLVCKYCGHELRKKESSVAVMELCQRLQKVQNENQAIFMIENFPIPNTREDIFEFMILAYSNFDALYYNTHLHVKDVSDAWLSKIEQCYQKALLFFDNPEDFRKIEAMYNEIKIRCETNEMITKNNITAQEQESSATTFLKGKFKITLIIFSLIAGLFCSVAFSNGRLISGIIAAAMLLMLVIAFLFGGGVIKSKIRNVYLLPSVLSFLLVIPYFMLYNMTNL
ncbi:MAG: zinc-ribbon domain-containing protein [Clostridia bacterium]|nr:zinc-ribbon domain-containing protein [Clostridia bacterium]